jgi:hypothetical protein
MAPPPPPRTQLVSWPDQFLTARLSQENGQELTNVFETETEL